MLGEDVVSDHRGTAIKHNGPKDQPSDNLSLLFRVSLHNYDCVTLKSK